jgi:hypothetical protein
LLLLRDSFLNLCNRDFYKIPNKAFNLLLAYLIKYKKEFILKAYKGLKRAIEINSVKKFIFYKEIQLKNISINKISLYPEISDKLFILA